MYVIKAAIVGFWLILFSGPAFAQALFPREVVEPRTDRPAVKDDDGAVVDEQTDTGLPSVSADVVFRINKISVEGSSVYDASAFDALAAEFTGRDLRFADLSRLTSEIEALYRADGYLAVDALVPAQTVEDGTLKITVVEGIIRQIEIRGDLGRSRSQIEAILADLANTRPIDRSETERRLLLARDTAGVNLSSALRALPSGGDGALQLIVDGSFEQIDGFVTLSNFGSEEVGPFTLTAGAAVNSAIIPGDRIQGVVVGTPEFGEQIVGQASLQLPVHPDGLFLNISGSIGRAKPEGDVSALDIDYRSWIGKAGLEYTAIRTRDRSLWVEAGLEATRQRTTSVAGPALNVNEDLRIVFGQARFLENDFLYGSFFATAEGRAGLNVLGANQEGDPGLSPSQSDPQFFLGRASLATQQTILPELDVNFLVRGQVGSSGLPSLEAFSLGNYTVGRGFDPGTLTGDSGLASSLELRYSPDLPVPEQIDRIEFFGFAEGGMVWSPGLSAGLASGGVGVRADLFDRVSAEVSASLPAIQPSFVDADDVSVLLRVTAFY